MWLSQERSWQIVRPRSLNKDFFKRIVEKVDGGGGSRWSFWSDKGSVWDLSGLKDMFHMLEQLVILSRSAETEEAAACQSKG